MKKPFETLTSEELWKLRQQISLNSLLVDHYKNSFGYNPSQVAEFFDGYYDYLWELAEEEAETDNLTHEEVMEFDTETNLWAWFNCHDEFGIEFEEEDDKPLDD